MRILPSGSSALLVEVEDLDQVLALYAALSENRPDGVVDLVPAGRTILLVIDPRLSTLTEVAAAVHHVSPRRNSRPTDVDVVEIAVRYDGSDLDDVATALGCSPAEVVARHTADRWTVAFCGFAPGFGYLVGTTYEWQVPRRATPRTRVPAGAVGLAGEFSGVYPRPSPGGWQLIGHTDHPIFDLDRDPAALLRPGVPVRFVNAEGAGP